MKGTLEDRVVQPLPHPLPQMGGGLDPILLLNCDEQKTNSVLKKEILRFPWSQIESGIKPLSHLGESLSRTLVGRMGVGLNLTIFLFLLFSACRSPYATLVEAPGISPDCVRKFRPTFSSFMYKTEVDVVGNQFNGILVFKTMPDSSRRVVFTSETGPTFFDFEFKQDRFRVVYCLKKLNRKAVIQTLRKDFELLLMQNPGRPAAAVLRDSAHLYFPFVSGKETNYYVTDTLCQNLLRIEKSGRRKTKVTVAMEPFQGGMPENVRIVHRNFTFAIRLTVLNPGNH
jgi:hypothetical protein